MIASPPTLDFRELGEEALAAMQRDFLNVDSRLYAETSAPGKPGAQPAFNWGVGVALSALNSAAKLDPGYKPWLRDYADRIRVYWNDAPPVAGFDVLPGPKSPDRYYDDNAWMVLSLMETYAILKDGGDLELAKRALDYVLSGESKRLGGGIYWRESDKASKNTCSNGPSIAAAMAVYSVTRDATLLETSERLYAWTKAKLQDPADGLYWDNVDLSGKVEKTKWSYNTALMITSAKKLYLATEKPGYLADARRMEQAAKQFWLVEDGAGGLKCDAQFAHLLLESWMEAPAMPDANAIGARVLAFVGEKVRDERGRYTNRWEVPTTGPIASNAILSQASAARAFLYFAGQSR
jgi:uncharacterized protein YyaL (SSP411 family)